MLATTAGSWNLNLIKEPIIKYKTLPEDLIVTRQGKVKGLSLPHFSLGTRTPLSCSNGYGTTGLGDLRYKVIKRCWNW